MSDDRKPITDAELAKILEVLSKAYEEAGKKITFATKHVGDDTEILIDNRDKERLN